MVPTVASQAEIASLTTHCNIATLYGVCDARFTIDDRFRACYCPARGLESFVCTLHAFICTRPLVFVVTAEENAHDGQF